MLRITYPLFFTPHENYRLNALSRFFTKKPEALYAITAGWPGKELVLRGVKGSEQPILDGPNRRYNVNT